MYKKFRVATVVGVLAALVVPATATAATKTVAAGPPLAKPPAGVPEYSDVQQFFPATTAVHVGDSVQWKFFGFHSVYFPKKGGKNATFVKADPSRKYDVKDPDGNPFWFNGRPQLVANPGAVFPLGGKTVTGRSVTSSGVPQGRTFSYKTTFRKAGTYTYFCTIHPRMKATVKVLPRSARVPSAAADKKAVSRQLSKAIAEVKRNDKRAAVAGNVVEVGRDTFRSALLSFFPAKKTVSAGTTVTFRMSPRTNEFHTVTFGRDSVLGRGGYAQKLGRSLLAPLPGTGKNGPPVLGIPGALFYPSDPGKLSFDGSQHGGFLNAGALAESPLPTKTQVTFPAAGTFTFVCLVHPEMRGQIIVK